MDKCVPARSFPLFCQSGIKYTGYLDLAQIPSPFYLGLVKFANQSRMMMEILQKNTLRSDVIGSVHKKTFAGFIRWPLAVGHPCAYIYASGPAMMRRWHP